MKVFKSLDDLPDFKNSVLTIGTYDGIHFGHQRIISRIKQLARQLKGESILITFDPHPRTIVNDNTKVELLSPLEEKIDLLTRYGVDNMVIVPFTRSFSEQSPKDYIEQFLVKNFQPKCIVIGYNHRFGKNRVGDIDFLRTLAPESNFIIEEISKQLVDDISVSSTKIRKALREGRVEDANKLLKHHYFLRGVVVRGQQLGQKIGFPTANILIEDANKLIPSNGVYAVTVKVREKHYQGMLNIGFRPTVGGKQRTIEVNLFDFEENIYGELLEIFFVKQIRQEQKFANLQGLIEQLKKDKITALSYLTELGRENS